MYFDNNGRLILVADVPGFGRMSGEYRHYYIERNPEFIAEMIECERQFAECVIAKIPPPMDGSKATSDTLLRLYPTNTKVTLPADEISLANRDKLWSIRDQIKSLEKQQQTHTFTIQHAIGFAEKMEGVAKWKVREVERLNESLLKETDPEVYNQAKLQGEGTARVLRPKAAPRTKEEKIETPVPPQEIPIEE